MSEPVQGLRKIDDYRWEIPVTAKRGMRVPGLIFASEDMLSHVVNDRCQEQVANVAFLPGIQKYSMAMPDVHWGYGFPIGGVAATDPKEGGVVSPGGVGFDINCTDGNTLVLLEHGMHLRIKDFAELLGGKEAKVVNLKGFSLNNRKVLLSMKRPESFIYDIMTMSGRRLRVTADHPVYTKDGMKAAATLQAGSSVAIFGFTGNPYSRSSDEEIANEDTVQRILESNRGPVRGNSIQQILKDLRQRKILPLTYANANLPYLAKIMGYVFGDGSISFVAGKKGVTWFYGEEEDLEQIRADVARIGFKPSRIYKRSRAHKITTRYRTNEFVRTESSFKVASTGFAALLVALGTPSGLKTTQPYLVPPWLFKTPLWIKRLFLAALFGADMSAPATLNKYNFYMPTLGMNKLETLEANAKKFLTQIKTLLADFGVDTSSVSKVEGYRYPGKHGSTCGYRIQVLGNPWNLVRFFEKVSFEYHQEKFRDACLAANYVRIKEAVKEHRHKTRDEARASYAAGVPAGTLLETLSTAYAPRQFIEHSIWSKRDGNPRIAFNFASFEEYKRENALGNGGLAWDEIINIQKEPFGDWVYDITVDDKYHNFIADGIVVSNCGVRLMRSDLKETDVRSVLKDLVRTLFQSVPCGVGSHGKIKVSAGEMRRVLSKGARWAVEQGYGTAEDLEYTESNGCLTGNIPEEVSARALERGGDQLGTLGSGNHFAEVQVVEKIYDEETARVFGLSEGLVTVMIHSGSRGLGYQVCDDFLRALRHAPEKYGIAIPDRQLVAAPVHSPEGERYMGAMAAAANFAWANRQCLMHLARTAFEKMFGKGYHALGMRLVYDVAHNIAKMENHEVNGKRKQLCVHRKGATRAFPAGHPEIPGRYRPVGQPVIVPGDMGRYSFVMAGNPGAMAETFGSVCHGAGRQMSRSAAGRAVKSRELLDQLEQKGIIVMAEGRSIVSEEAPLAYKDVNQVVEVVEKAGLARRVARMKPMGVIKG